MWFIIGILAVISLGVYVYRENNALVTTHYDIQSDDLPGEFNSFRIIQLSDLHGKYFGKSQEKILKRIKDEQPDMILFTGDLIDYRRYKEEGSLLLMEKLVDLAPVYFVIGNHEVWSENINSLEEKLMKRGVNVLRNQTVEIEKGASVFQLTGIDDPANDDPEYEDLLKTTDDLNQALADIENSATFTLLMAHRPELLSVYSEYEFDLVVAGHAHGGQFRIPGIGGLFAPNQGLFPTYMSGIHEKNNTQMVVNRGLANSTFPVRLNNRPEVVVITLHAK